MNIFSGPSIRKSGSDRWISTIYRFRSFRTAVWLIGAQKFVVLHFHRNVNYNLPTVMRRQQAVKVMISTRLDASTTAYIALDIDTSNRRRLPRWRERRARARLLSWSPYRYMLGNDIPEHRVQHGFLISVFPRPYLRLVLLR